MAVTEYEPISDFEDWYLRRSIRESNDTYVSFDRSKRANELIRRFESFKTEHDKRVANYWKYETMADAEVVSKKADLPNVSSGEIAGMVRRTARNIVQHTPNVEIICEFDDDSPKGIFARFVLMSKIIGDEFDSNAMQQNLFASTMSSFTLGFEAVTPVLTQRADQSWCMEYDAINYRDVFPEPGVKDARKSPEFFVRRYLTKGELAKLIRGNAAGWDIRALKTLAQRATPPRRHESASHQDKKHHTIPDGYEIVTWYSNSGDHFLTFDVVGGLLLRIEVNKDPLKRVPVHMLILEKDLLQPLGKSQIALVFGRQEFQDLMLNGAMKLWYRNINPTLIGYGTGLNAPLNMSPGKYNNVPNPNAKIEAFEVNTQTLMQYGSIALQNQGAMVNLIGAADQQMAAQAGNGMSATPQGVEAQQSMVDITTNNYQKAVENFFSNYCSHALTVYFQEVRSAKYLRVSADTKAKLLDAGMPAEQFTEQNELMIDMSEMATTYHVRCVPGSLVEMEDEKQLRILNELFVPLSQSMGAIKESGNMEALANATAALQFIIAKEIELSGSSHAEQLKTIYNEGVTPQLQEYDAKVGRLEGAMGEFVSAASESTQAQAAAISEMQNQIRLLTESQTVLLQKLGVQTAPSGAPEAQPLAS